MSDDGNEIAIWSISLDLECPKCHHMWDVSGDCPDIHVGEVGTGNMATCPKCDHEFEFNTEY